MNEARRLIYEDKTSLNEFNIKEPGSLNNLVYAWLKKRTEIDPFDAKSKDYYLKTFNDAYYICTLALLLPVGMELKPSATMNYVERPSIVFPMVHLFLSRLNGGTYGIKDFLDIIETKCKIDFDWEQNFIQLQETVAGCADSIEQTNFAQRVLTKDVLSNIKWEELTNTFDKKRIEAVVSNYARNRDIWNMMCEAIKEAAISYDYDYGFEEYEQEGVDEDGPYVQSIKVPRNPYDCEGNEILDPLKRAGVYEFCDELKEKYDELALVSQKMIQESLSQGGSDDKESKESCFKFLNDYVKELVKKALKVCNNHGSDLALLEITLYDHNLLKERNSHLSFLRGLVDWGLLPDISNADNPEDEFKKTVQRIRDKAKKLPKDGKYIDWDNNYYKAKAKCIEIGKRLGNSLPYKN